MDKTKGIALRLKQSTIVTYERIAHRANGIALRHGKPAHYTKQDVMRHRLEKLPFVQAEIDNLNANTKKDG